MTGAPIEFQLGADAVAMLSHVAKTWTGEKIAAELESFLKLESQIVAGQVSRSVRDGSAGLDTRTGLLGKSIVGRFETYEGAPSMRVGVLQGPALRYAGVQEYGTQGKNPQSPYPTIRPKRAKALAVPVGPALTEAGVARFLTPRDYPGELVFAKSSKANVVGYLIDRDEAAFAELKGRKQKIAAAAAKLEKTNATRAKQGLEPLKGGRAKLPSGVTHLSSVGLNDVGINGLGTIAYVLLAKADIAPKFYLRKAFLKAIEGTSARLAKRLAQRIANEDGGAAGALLPTGGGS